MQSVWSSFFESEPRQTVPHLHVPTLALPTIVARKAKRKSMVVKRKLILMPITNIHYTLIRAHTPKAERCVLLSTSLALMTRKPKKMAMMEGTPIWMSTTHRYSTFKCLVVFLQPNSIGGLHSLVLLPQSDRGNTTTIGKHNLKNSFEGMSSMVVFLSRRWYPLLLVQQLEVATIESATREMTITSSISSSREKRPRSPVSDLSALLMIAPENDVADVRSFFFSPSG